MSCAHVKGGVGKTSLAVNLAIHFSGYGEDVLLIDADPQATSVDFSLLRQQKVGDSGYTCTPLHGLAVRTDGRALARKHDRTVIDVGGRDSEALRCAILISDLVVIPNPPGSFEAWSIDAMARLVGDARAAGNEDLRAVAFLNMADAWKSSRYNVEAAEELRKTAGIEFIDAPLIRRAAWRAAAAEGKALWEASDPDEKAVREFEALRRAIDL